jgi:putative transposase
MKTSPGPHYRHRFPAEIISHAVWLYHVFSLSLRDVELILAQRGVFVSYETVRRWCQKVGESFALGLRRRRPRPGDKWHLDEVFIRIRGELHYLRGRSTSMASSSTFWFRGGVMAKPPTDFSSDC